MTRSAWARRLVDGRPDGEAFEIGQGGTEITIDRNIAVWNGAVNLLASLNSMEERPWSEYRKGKGMAASNLARLLRPHGIESRTVRIGAGTSKGYLRSSFEDSWTRYTPLPAATPLGEVTTSQPRESGKIVLPLDPNVTSQKVQG